MQSIPFFHMPHKRAAQKGAAAKGAAQEAAQAFMVQQQQQQDLLRSQQAMKQPQRLPDGMRSRQEVTAGQQLLDSTLSGMGSADNRLEVGVPHRCLNLATALSVDGCSHVWCERADWAVLWSALQHCSLSLPLAATMLQETFSPACL